MIKTVESLLESVHNISLGTTSIQPKTTVRNLDFLLDSELNLNSHVNQVVRSGYFQRRQLRIVYQYLSTENVKTLVHAFICNKIDYCNSLYYRANSIIHKKLQSLLNSAARLIIGQHKYDHISETLRILHWLRIPQRIDYKIASITRRSLIGAGPQYVSEYLTPVGSIQGRAHLRSADQGLLVVPRT